MNPMIKFRPISGRSQHFNHIYQTLFDNEKDHNQQQNYFGPWVQQKITSRASNRSKINQIIMKKQGQKVMSKKASNQNRIGQLRVERVIMKQKKKKVKSKQMKGFCNGQNRQIRYNGYNVSNGSNVYNRSNVSNKSIGSNGYRYNKHNGYNVQNISKCSLRKSVPNVFKVNRIFYNMGCMQKIYHTHYFQHYFNQNTYTPKKYILASPGSLFDYQYMPRHKIDPLTRLKIKLKASDTNQISQFSLSRPKLLLQQRNFNGNWSRKSTSLKKRTN